MTRNILKMLSFTKSFADNKDKAKILREKHLLPAIKNGHKIVIDFTGIESTTQSFVHALISQACRKYSGIFLELVEFHGCNKYVKEMIKTVINYSMED